MTVSSFSSPCLAAQPDGELVLAGNVSGNFTLLRYSADGQSLDSIYSGGANLVPTAVAVQPSGRIVVAVDSVMGGTDSWALARFTENGTPDASFSGTGVEILGTGIAGEAAALAIQPDGKILLAGTSATDAVMARYTSGGLGVQVSDVGPGPLTLTASAGDYSGTDNMVLSGSFANNSPQESLSVSIDWGDGSPLTTFSLDPEATTFQYPAQQYLRSGQYTIIVTVTDANGLSASNSVSVNYSNPPPADFALTPDQSTIYAGGEVNLSGSFADLQSNITHTVTINWGDGTGGTQDTTTLSLNAGETTFQADPHTYSTAGNYSISATVSGADGSTTATTSMTVNSATTIVVSSPTSPTYDQPVAFTATVASAVSGNGPPTGTVDFYDETTGADLGTAWLESNGAASLCVSVLALGGHTITATYSGDNNFPTSQASTSVTITPQTLSIENVSIASTIDKGGIATLTGSVAGLDGAGFILTVGWGEYQGAADSITYPPDTSTFSITHHYVDDASHPFAVAYAVTITVTASDGDGRLPVTDNLTISGDGVAPSVNIAGGPTAIVGNGQSVSVSAVVADPGENCTAFTYQWTATSGTDHHSQIGTSGTFDFVAAFDANYTISLAVTDPDGKTGNASLLIPGDSGGCVTPFQPDVPSVTIEECEADGTPDPSCGAGREHRVLPGVPCGCCRKNAGARRRQGVL